LGEIEKIMALHARRYAVEPMLREEPVGVDRLLELAATAAETPEHARKSDDHE
jgi:arsenite/tail-anchored protein-transporting ATPase